MDLWSWALFGLAAVGALGVAVHLYRRREAPGRGRSVLALVRWAVLALLILLLFDPEVPVPGLAAGRSTERVLVDASLSMMLPVEPGDSVTRWRRAAEEARRRAGGDAVLLFGAGTRLEPADSLAALEPTATRTRLLPALTAAAEAGARRVVVLTDGGIEDAAEVERMLPRLGLDLEIRPIGTAAATNLSLAEVEAPAWAEAGEPLRIEFGVQSVGAAAGDTISVQIRQQDRVLATARVARPEAGRIATGTLEFEPTAPPGGGLVRYDVALESSDAAPDDDTRSVYVHVGERPAGIALVSLRPDWEPRFLLPVLEQSLGLPVHGFLWTSSGRWIETGTGSDAGGTAEEAEVRRIVGEADLVVLHGLGGDAPAWAAELARTARRTLIFPAPLGTPDDVPLALPPAAPGEWYATADVPASPVASLLSGIDPRTLPPLEGLRPVTGITDAWAPMLASRRGSGAGAPVVVAGESEDRRWAVATAQGYWRWAFRGGTSRQIYRRLWSAVGGWLVQEEFIADGDAVRPAESVARRGEPVAWVASGLAADSIGIRVTDAAGSAVTDTVVPAARGDSAYTAALPPGHYRYEARAFVEGEEAVASEGPISVDGYSPEFSHAAVALAGFNAARGAEGAARIPARGEPLHTLPWVYLLIILLVSTEWILRRRWGLR